MWLVFVCFVLVRACVNSVCCVRISLCGGVCVFVSVRCVCVRVSMCLCVLFAACCAMLYGLPWVLVVSCSRGLLNMCVICA